MFEVTLEAATKKKRGTAESGSLVQGVILDAANPHTESANDVLEAVVEVSGAAEYQYHDPGNELSKAIATTTLLRPTLARSLLRWQPRKPGLVDGMPTYYAAWQAFR